MVTGSYWIQKPDGIDALSSSVVLTAALGKDDCFLSAGYLERKMPNATNKNDKPKAPIMLRLAMAITLMTHHADSWPP